MNSRRGYNDASMNTNELIWNAQVSQSFLRGNALTLSLQMYDILHQQSTFSRTVDAMRRSDTEYNAITNYAMLHVIYRLNIFGGKNGGPRGHEGGPYGRRGGGFGGPMVVPAGAVASVVQGSKKKKGTSRSAFSLIILPFGRQRYHPLWVPSPLQSL